MCSAGALQRERHHPTASLDGERPTTARASQQPGSHAEAAAHCGKCSVHKYEGGVAVCGPGRTTPQEGAVLKATLPLKNRAVLHTALNNHSKTFPPAKRISLVSF